MTTLSNNIRVLRRKTGLTQKDLSRICEVSTSAVSQWESPDKAVSPDLDKLLKLARHFDVSVDQLLDSNDPIACTQRGAGIDTSLMQKAFQALALNRKIYDAFVNQDSHTQSSIFSLFCILSATVSPRDLVAEPKLLEALKLLKKT